MNFTELSVTEFTDKLASKSSVPGGGGACALAAAIGIALGDMVGEFTVGKKKYAAVEEDIITLMNKANELKDKLIKCIEDDALAFEPLSKAYSIPKDDPERDEIMEKCLKDAAKAPFDILELACRAIDVQKDFASKGSTLMISDAATGVSLLLGALRGAAVNVYVNTKLMKDREYADSLNKRVEDLVNHYEKKANDIYFDVLNRL